jgi:predicted ArsR family transcriptional regulator
VARLPWADRMAALASLGDEKRRQLFELVSSSRGAVGRDDVAQRTGLPRSTVSFHLDRLVQDGLLAVEFHKPPGKAGPGSGRPAKMYRPVAAEIGASVPDRNYDLAGELMAAAIERSTSVGEPIEDTLPSESWRVGNAMAEAAETLQDFLVQAGYRPQPDGDGGFLLPNCPFHRLSDKHPGVVCTMNGAFLQGAAARLEASGGRVAPADVPGHCCARITPSA